MTSISTTNTVCNFVAIDSNNANPTPSISLIRNALNDIEAMQRNDKGKGRADSDKDLTDEGYAMKLQAEYLQDTLRAMEDFELAKKVNQSAESITSFNPQVDHATSEYRQTLLALLVKAGLPGPSNQYDNHDIACPPPHDPDKPDVADTTNTDPGPDVGELTAPPVTSGFPLFNWTDFGYPTVNCMTCGDLVVGEPTLHAPCGHDYCVDCVEDLVTSCTRDESLFPPKCCRQPIPPENITPFLTIKLNALFESKRVEFGIPAPHRIFCPNPTCSRFLGSCEGISGNLVCQNCSTAVCTSCKHVAHSGETCADSVGMRGLKTLAESKRWQKCPGCRTFVELTVGCNHMVCRCGVQFCYRCGVLWKGCRC